MRLFREQKERFDRVLWAFRLAEDLILICDDRVGADDYRGKIQLLGDGEGFAPLQLAHHSGRRAGRYILVAVACNDLEAESHLQKQLAASRRTRGEDDFFLHKLLRFFLFFDLIFILRSLCRSKATG